MTSLKNCVRLRHLQYFSRAYSLPLRRYLIKVISYTLPSILPQLSPLMETLMAKNRFERVDQIQPDAILLTLKREGEGAVGCVALPASATGGRVPQDMVTGFAPAQDAFRNAIRLANRAKVPVVVLDPDDVWNAEWGELYRPID